MNHKSFAPLLPYLVFALTAAIFIVDLVVPFGQGVLILYLIPILFSGSLSRRDIAITALLGVFFACLAMALKPYQVFSRQLLFSRLTYIALMAGIFYYLYQRRIWEDKINSLLARMKIAEEAREKAEAEIEIIFRTAAVGMGIILPGRILKKVNDSMCRLVDYEREELEGKNTRMLYFDDREYERVGREKYGRMAEAGKGFTGVTLRRKDGTPVSIYLSLEAIDKLDLSRGFVFSALDISQRKRGEEELRRQRNIFRGRREFSRCRLPL
jgi:PAS domain S-box-containing protein